MHNFCSPPPLHRASALVNAQGDQLVDGVPRNKQTDNKIISLDLAVKPDVRVHYRKG